MAHIGKGDLSRIEVLEGDIRGLHHVLEHLPLLIHLTGVVGIEGEGLAGEVHLLQLTFLLPGAVLHCEVHVGAVAAAGVGEHPAGRIPQARAFFLRLLESVLTNEVLLQRLVGLGSHLHGLIDQRHLVDEQIAEHTGAVHHHINAGAAEFFQGNQLKLVHPTHGVRHRLDANEPEDLSQGFAVGLDVVGSPEHAGDGFGPGALLLALTLNQLVDNTLGCSHRCTGGNRLRVEGVDVLAAGQHTRIPNRITTGARKDVFTIESLQQTLHLHVGTHLLKAEAQIGKELVELGGIDLHEASTAAGPQPRRGELEAELGQQVVEPTEAVAQADATITAGERANHGANGSAGCLRDRAVELYIGEDALVVAFVDVFDRAAHRLSQQAGE